MPLCVHLSREIAVLLILDISVFCQERHRFHREREDATRTLIVEPIHETTLEPIKALPMRSLTIREAEIIKEGFEIITVVVTDIPEYRLEITRTGWLVQAINDLLEAIGDHLVDCTAFLTQIHHFVRAFIVILAELLLDEIVHIHKELGRSARA